MPGGTPLNLDTVFTRALLLLLYAFIASLITLSGCSSSDTPVIPGIDADNHASDGSSFGEQTSDTENPGSYVENEVLVVLEDSLSSEQGRTLLSNLPLRLVKTTDLRWAILYTLEITDGSSVEENVRRLQGTSGVRIAEPNHIYEPLEVPHYPDDPYYEDLNGVNDGDASNNEDDMFQLPKVGADLVWNEFDGSGVVVAVHDTGWTFEHEDLQGQLWINEDDKPDNEIDDDKNGYTNDWCGWDFSDDDNYPEDESGYYDYHGTKMSGIIGAVQDNGLGVTGISPGCRMMPVKINFQTDVLTISLIYAFENGADICNMSWGGGPDEIIHETIKYVWDDGDGMLLVSSSGNSNEPFVLWPAAYEEVIGVGGTVPFGEYGLPLREDRISPDNSSWGANYGENINMAAYGSGIKTTWFFENFYKNNCNGTSCSTALVSGAAALLLEAYPDQNAQWLFNRLVHTSDDLLEPGFDIETGWGRLNVFRAIYGVDRYEELEDENGFVPLEFSDEWLYESIHAVPGTMYPDGEDLYRVTAGTDGYLSIIVDIKTWGENFDIAVFSDPEMVYQVAGSSFDNTPEASSESIAIPVTAGEEYFVKVYSPEPGNSSTYGIRAINGPNSVSVTGEDVSVEWIHLEGTRNFLDVEITTPFFAELDQIVFNKSGSLPLENISEVVLQVQMTENNYTTVATAIPDGTNRFRFTDLGLVATSASPLGLRLRITITEPVDECTVSFSVESYKDVVFTGGLEAHYAEFLITCGPTIIGWETFPPYWLDTVGVQTVTPYYGVVVLGYDRARDEHNTPVHYNVYWTDTLPFDIDTANKIPHIKRTHVYNQPTYYISEVSGLPVGEEIHFVIRAEDDVGNEEENLVMISTTTLTTGEPSYPVIAAYYPFSDPSDVDVHGDTLVLTDRDDGLLVFDCSEAPVLTQVAGSTGTLESVSFDGDYAYCSAAINFRVVRINTVMGTAEVTDSINTGMVFEVEHYGSWVYATQENNMRLLTFDCTDPYDISETSSLSAYGGYGKAVTDGYLYIASNTLRVFDRSDPGQPEYLEGITSSKRHVMVEGYLLYAQSYDSGLIEIYDIGVDPVDPPRLDWSSGFNSGYGEGLVKVGDYVYGVYDEYGICVFDVSNPMDIISVGWLELGEGATAIATDGTFIYVVVESDGLYVII